MRWFFCVVVGVFSLSASGAEKLIEFGSFPDNHAPPGFTSTVAGVGKPGDWRVLLEDVPSQLPALSPKALGAAKQAVLAQLSQDTQDEHFPLLIYDGEVFDDFTLTTHFKTVKGSVEQMAGIAFRILNETNYYVVRASSLGNNFRFYKVVNGQRGTIIGPELPVPSGVWHDLTIECKGPQIRCLLDGKESIPVLTDTSFTRGKIGFWTKSDSVSYFGDTRIVYTPREAPAQAAVRDICKKYPRVLGLKVYVAEPISKRSRVVASSKPEEIGEAGRDHEDDVLAAGSTYYGKSSGTLTVTMPLRDRNGEVVGAVRVMLKAFAGQTQQNALARATPIVREMQARVQSIEDLAPL